MEREKRKSKKREIRNSSLCGSSGKSRVNSMVLSISQRKEISSTMCIWYVRGGSALQKLASLTKSSKMQNKKSVSSEIRQGCGAGQSFDYIYRRRALRTLRLMEFV